MVPGPGRVVVRVDMRSVLGCIALSIEPDVE